MANNGNNPVYDVKYKSGAYVPPVFDLLKNYTSDDVFMAKERVKSIGDTIQMTLDSFKINAKVVRAKATPLAITYSISLEPGVSVKSIMKLQPDFSLRVSSDVEIDGGNGDESLLKMSVKNMNRPLVGLRTIIESQQFEDAESPLTVAGGIDYQGNPLILDICEAPHILIAGTTGSGKSVFIDDIILSTVYKSSPDDVRLLLIDPKKVELLPYNGIPHLLNPVISDPDESLDSFLWIEDEMMKRYDIFGNHGTKTIVEYNKIAKKHGEKGLPRLLIIIDEFADLMMRSPKELNQIVDRVSSMGRGAGIHLILATQLPVAQIVTGTIKNNLRCRISFTVVDGVESRAILDKAGAERLLGNGDMIYSSERGAVHAQAAYVSEKEVNEIVRYIKKNN